MTAAVSSEMSNKLGFLKAMATEIINSEPQAIACVIVKEDGIITLWHGSGAELFTGMKTLAQRIYRMEKHKEGDMEKDPEYAPPENPLPPTYDD